VRDVGCPDWGLSWFFSAPQPDTTTACFQLFAIHLSSDHWTLHGVSIEDARNSWACGHEAELRWHDSSYCFLHKISYRSDYLLCLGHRQIVIQIVMSSLGIPSFCFKVTKGGKIALQDVLLNTQNFSSGTFTTYGVPSEICRTDIIFNYWLAITTGCPDERYPNKIIISQKTFIIHIYGLHHYKGKLSKFLFWVYNFLNKFQCEPVTVAELGGHDRGFESHLGHGCLVCMYVFILCLCCTVFR
jgi:hypothetical protein